MPWVHEQFHISKYIHLGKPCQLRFNPSLTPEVFSRSEGVWRMAIGSARESGRPIPWEHLALDISSDATCRPRKFSKTQFPSMTGCEIVLISQGIEFEIRAEEERFETDFCEQDFYSSSFSYSPPTIRSRRHVFRIQNEASWRERERDS